MPRREAETIGYCASCQLRVALDAENLVPWHRYGKWGEIGIPGDAPICVGVGQPAVGIERPDNADLEAPQQSLFS